MELSRVGRGVLPTRPRQEKGDILKIMASQSSQKPPSDRTSVLHSLSLIQIFRCLGIVLPILWIGLFHIGIVSQAPFRVSFRVKIIHTIITAFFVLFFISCLSGRIRIVLGCLMVLVAAWTLWGYWRLPAF